MNHEITAQAETTIAAPPAEVWKALTSPEDFKTFFFGTDVETDWMMGSPIRMRGEMHGKPYEAKGDILHVERPELLSFSHWSALSGMPDLNENYQVVTFRLAPEGEGTRVTLSQSNLVGGVKASDREQRAAFEANWREVLEGLSKLFPPAR
ncbi:MAG: hypothetical protein JWQ72_4020 [Polaromonas sp.]|nr:hypothetical protein [Polaromonas sp.]